MKMHTNGTSGGWSFVKSIIKKTWKCVALAFWLYSGTQSSAQMTTTNILTKIGGYDSGTNGFSGIAVEGKYAYLVGGEGLVVVDVSNPTNCFRVGGYQVSGLAWSVALSGKYAFLPIFTNGFEIVDVSDPTNCVRAGGLAIGEWNEDIAVAGNYAYIPSISTMHVIDVSNPANCVEVGSCRSPWGYAIQLAGDYAYVAGGPFGLDVIDIHQPNNPVHVFNDPPPFGKVAQNVAISGNYAYLVAKALEIYDISTLSTPVRVGGYAPDRNLFAVAASGNYAYVGTSPELEALDVTNPTSPKPVAKSHDNVDVQALKVIGDYIYVADAQHGLVILQHQVLPVVRSTLSITQENGQHAFSWPVDENDLQLYTAADLSAAASWTKVEATPVKEGSNWVVRILADGNTQRFYRLQK